MEMSVERRIEQFVSVLESYGYVVISEPVRGKEEQFAEHLKLAYDRVIATTVVNETRYKTRGRSKRALANLHSALPNPAWGVEVNSFDNGETK